MNIFHYDKTFEGLLTAIFDAYFRRTFPHRLLATGELDPLFVEQSHEVVTQTEKASRVWRALERKLPRGACNMILHVWLSEEPGSDELLMRYIRKVFDATGDITTHFADPDVLEVKQIAMKVSREGEHVRQFVRFQQGGDGTYFAPIAPKYNALPLAIVHFTDRFADQSWLVYDTKRRYGYYYDRKKATEVTLEEDEHLLSGRLDDTLLAADEKLFQEMWRSYFKALTIKERINPKLQRQHMPRRFWKFLTEKQ